MGNEILTVLTIGYSIFICAALIAIIYFWKNYKSYRDVYVWIIAHLVLISAAVVLGLKAIKNVDDAGNLSSLITGDLLPAGIFWGVSIICLLIGALKVKSKFIKESADKK